MSLEWIINLPMWVVDAFFFIIIGIADLIILLFTWLNPVTMIKGVIKMIFFMLKVIFAFIFDIFRHIFEIFLRNFLSSLDPDYGVFHIFT